MDQIKKQNQEISKMDVETYAYEFRFKVGDDDTVIFVGTTTNRFVHLLSNFQSTVNKIFGKDVEPTVYYQPLKNLQNNGTQKNS